MVDDEIVYQFQLSQQRHHADYSTLVKFPGHENNFSAIEHWSCHGSCDLQRNLHLSAAAYAKSGITFQLNFSVLRRAADILCMQIADHQIISFQQFGENPNNILRNMVYRVSQQVWNRLRNVGQRSEHRLRKNCISLQKIAFSAFFPELQK